MGSTERLHGQIIYIPGCRKNVPYIGETLRSMILREDPMGYSVRMMYHTVHVVYHTVHLVYHTVHVVQVRPADTHSVRCRTRYGPKLPPPPMVDTRGSSTGGFEWPSYITDLMCGPSRGMGECRGCVEHA
eukprot:GHVO01009630.1.p1 GENE.GHVO01009630.1~~GHVO01009630.1.p1  ORF type:complete len:130 (+),score=21.48 GHVO01009630.1:195-584(+)